MDVALDPIEPARPEHTATLRVPDPLHERAQRPFEDVMPEAPATALPPLLLQRRGHDISDPAMPAPAKDPRRSAP
jgi:hypothetical protein